MAQDLELTRSPDDRRTFELPGHGSVRLEGMWGRSAAIEVGDRRLVAKRKGFPRSQVEITTPDGAPVGSFTTSGAFRRGGTLKLDGHRYGWAPSSTWHVRFALTDGETQLAHFAVKGWGKKPVKVHVEDAGSEHSVALTVACWLAKIAGDQHSGSTAATAGAAASS